jgi:inosine-uridine nucleoside N-ribohydrolase
MIKNILILFCSLLIISFAQAQNKKIKPVIFDTDMGPDYDDVGAITLLHAFADAGEVNILATMASTKYEGVAAVLNVLNTYFKKPSIPIGVPKGFAITQKDWQHWTDTLIAKYPHAIKNNNDVPDAVSLYRKILAQQADKSVTIITVGFLTNISNLLQSLPDQYSSLNGKELVNKKVKQLVCMAGKFPEGFEFNIKEDANASRFVYEHWEKPVLFSGFEIGQKIKVGLPLINNNAIQNSPVKDVFRISIPLAKEDSAGRMSWDETAVLIAVKGYSPYYTIKRGKVKINDNGSDNWIPGTGNQFYIVQDKPVIEVQNLINTLIMHQPQ